MHLKPYTGPHAGNLYHVVDDKGRVIRNASALEVKLWQELQWNKQQHEEAKQQRDRLVKSLTPSILDWVSCGMAANGRHKQAGPMSQWHELHEAINEAKVKP